MVFQPAILWPRFSRQRKSDSIELLRLKIPSFYLSVCPIVLLVLWLSAVLCVCDRLRMESRKVLRKGCWMISKFGMLLESWLWQRGSIISIKSFSLRFYHGLAFLWRILFKKQKLKLKHKNIKTYWGAVFCRRCVTSVVLSWDRGFIFKADC